MMRVLGPPISARIRLDHRPQVLSWDRAGTPTQQRLVPYREEIRARFRDFVARPGVAFDLVCGLGNEGSLETLGDLDNFLGPVAYALGPDNTVAAWGAKTPDEVSYLAVGEPVETDLEESHGWQIRTVRTLVSAGGEAWKNSIASQLADLPPPAAEPIELVLHFRTGAGRNWRNLWKPAIDSLHAILGAGPRTWHPRDGLVYRLGLSTETDTSLGWAVELGIAWRRWTDA